MRGEERNGGPFVPSPTGRTRRPLSQAGRTAKGTLATCPPGAHAWSPRRRSGVVDSLVATPPHTPCREQPFHSPAPTRGASAVSPLNPQRLLVPPDRSLRTPHEGGFDPPYSWRPPSPARGGMANYFIYHCQPHDGSEVLSVATSKVDSIVAVARASNSVAFFNEEVRLDNGAPPRAPARRTYPRQDPKQGPIPSEVDCCIVWPARKRTRVGPGRALGAQATGVGVERPTATCPRVAPPSPRSAQGEALPRTISREARPTVLTWHPRANILLIGWADGACARRGAADRDND